MEFGQYELQIFVSLVVILAAACVALICDFLKSNNERLRELVIELKAGYEHQPQYTAATIETPAETARPLRREATTAFAHRERSALDRPRRQARPKPPGAQAVAPRIVPKAGPKKDWESLLERASAKAAASRPTQVVAKMSYAPAAGREKFTLEEFAREHRTVSGLVVSVGTSGANPLPDAVVRFIPTLLEGNEFVCRRGDREFVLFCPGERGAAAQRRLNHIAQQLWDFQLRLLGSLAVVFSWGGLEVNGESVDEAIALATERMLEADYGRQTLLPKLLLREPRRLRAAV